MGNDIERLTSAAKRSKVKEVESEKKKKKKKKDTSEDRNRNKSETSGENKAALPILQANKGGSSKRKLFVTERWRVKERNRRTNYGCSVTSLKEKYNKSENR